MDGDDLGELPHSVAHLKQQPRMLARIDSEQYLPQESPGTSPAITPPYRATPPRRPSTNSAHWLDSQGNTPSRRPSITGDVQSRRPSVSGGEALPSPGFDSNSASKVVAAMANLSPRSRGKAKWTHLQQIASVRQALVEKLGSDGEIRSFFTGDVHRQSCMNMMLTKVLEDRNHEDLRMLSDVMSKARLSSFGACVHARMQGVSISMHPRRMHAWRYPRG